MNKGAAAAPLQAAIHGSGNGVQSSTTNHHTPENGGLPPGEQQLPSPESLSYTGRHSGKTPATPFGAPASLARINGAEVPFTDAILMTL
ncbi:hypothetical protein OJAV_G00060840 [Oryzias javanicus]|uniref:Uncharacterized protein n=1 Tax=Oryzias javanicus TaxID=123683 RepID=A0A437DBN5_ORYJA|nr:hypothetical protein OJAV_G00060840 [Oryzias javanicus]